MVEIPDASLEAEHREHAHGCKPLAERQVLADFPDTWLTLLMSPARGPGARMKSWRPTQLRSFAGSPSQTESISPLYGSLSRTRVPLGSSWPLIDCPELAVHVVTTRGQVDLPEGTPQHLFADHSPGDFLS